MEIQVTTGQLEPQSTVILPVFTSNLEGLHTINAQLPEIVKQHNFKADKGEVLVLNSFGDFKKLIVLGLGEQKECFKRTYKSMNFGGKACSALNKNDEEITLLLTQISDTELVQNLAMNLSSGIRLKAYRFTKYFNDKKPKFTDPVNLKTIKVVTNNVDVSAFLQRAEALVQGMIFTRDLVIQSPSELNAEGFVNSLQELSDLGVEIQVLSQRELKEMGMNLLLSVNQASTNEAKVAIMKWNGGKERQKPVAFVGKGVTFDSGGLSLKSPSAMIGMKGDMAGAATVAGLMKTLAFRKAKVNAVGVVGLVENMVAGNATRPGDVVKSYSGKTVEILNTDAEGRLVLADVLYYTQEQFQPEIMIDLATLTGAIIITLGYLKAGLFCNDENLSQQLLAAGNLSDDQLWELPVGDEYRSMMDSEIADICNIGTIDRAAGSVTAAVFLKDFVGKTKWAHLDIAGVSWRETKSDLSAVGASGFGVRLLDTLVAKNYESE